MNTYVQVQSTFTVGVQLIVTKRLQLFTLMDNELTVSAGLFLRIELVAASLRNLPGYCLGISRGENFTSVSFVESGTVIRPKVLCSGERRLQANIQRQKPMSFRIQISGPLLQGQWHRFNHENLGVVHSGFSSGCK